MSKTNTSSDNSDNYSTNSLILSDQNDLTNQTNNTKYDKIVQDYVKLRSKLTILKKAYVELSETSTQKDQTIRKYEQELEGLNFRNQQLTSRVDILQRELETLKLVNSNAQKTSSTSLSTSNLNSTLPSLSPSSASLSSSSNSSSSLSILASNNKLDILSEELQRKINENASLHSRINDIEIDLKQKTSKLNSIINQLETDKLQLENKLDSVELSSKSLIEKLQNDKIKLEVNLVQIENQFKSNSNQQKTIELSAIVSKEVIVKQKDDCLSLIEQQAENLSKIYTYLSERLNLDRLDVSSRLALKCEQLFTKKLLPFVKDFVKGQSLDQNEMNLNLNEFFQCNNNLLEQLINTAQTATVYSSEFETINKKIKLYLNKLNNLLFLKNEENISFSFVLNQLINYAFFSVKTHPGSAFNLKFCADLQSFIDILDKLLFVYSEKLSLQYSESHSSNLNTIDECIVSYLTQFKQSLFDLLTLIKSSNGNSLGIIELVSKLNKSIQFDKTNYSDTEKEIDYLKQSISTKDLEIQKLIEKSQKESTELDRLKFKLDQLQTVINQLQNKEKQQQELIQSLNSQQQQQINLQPVKPDNDLENLKIDFYIKKVNSLNQQIQFLDSKCLFYYEELKSLSERLKLQTDLNTLQEVDLNEIKDQLERTRSSYELQMSTMSDHLIEMNDRMAKQSDENEKLKHELSNLMPNSNSKNSKIKKTK